jgi:hypothetical protein
VWADIAERTGLHETPEVPKPPTWDVHVQHAKAMREFLDVECSKKVCAVCSMMRRSVDVQEIGISEVPNLDLLDAAEPSTEALPRHALTTFTHIWNAPDDSTTYCLQPAACFCRDDGSVDIAVCTDCLRQLDKGRVPAESLVAFDTGMCGSVAHACLSQMLHKTSWSKRLMNDVSRARRRHSLGSF